MTRKGKIETAFEIARVFVYGDRWRASAAWCERCESYIPMVTALTAAKLENTADDEIISRVETKELHHWKTAEGAIFVCLGSLVDSSKYPAIA